jgi:RHS repeat-associated protein
VKKRQIIIKFLYLNPMGCLSLTYNPVLQVVHRTTKNPLKSDTFLKENAIFEKSCTANWLKSVKSCVRYYPFGMLVPNRYASSSSYRYGYQGSEKDDEIKGEGNSYTTHYRLLDPRIGRWLTRDPKLNNSESPYASMSNNPIFYNDVKGDTISYRGSRSDTEKIIKTYSDQLGSKNLKLNKIYDKNGNLKGVDIYKASYNVAKNGSESLNRELINVINSKENLRIFRVTTNPAELTEVRKKGGAISVDNSSQESRDLIKQYTGGNKFSRYVFMTDRFFEDNVDSGSYEYVEKQHSMWVDDEVIRRYIPFNEALFHETIHHSYSISGFTFLNYEEEENAVITVMNKWQVEHKIHERGLYIYYSPGLFGILFGQSRGYTPNPFEYDDYINESKTGGIYNRGEKRKDVSTPNKTGKTYE